MLSINTALYVLSSFLQANAQRCNGLTPDYRTAWWKRGCVRASSWIFPLCLCCFTCLPHLDCHCRTLPFCQAAKSSSVLTVNVHHLAKKKIQKHYCIDLTKQASKSLPEGINLMLVLAHFLWLNRLKRNETRMKGETLFAIYYMPFHKKFWLQKRLKRGLRYLKRDFNMI